MPPNGREPRRTHDRNVALSTLHNRHDRRLPRCPTRDYFKRSNEIMSNRHDRRKASATYSKSKLKSSTLDQHFEQTLRRIRTEFGRSGEIHPRFECVTDAESFDVPAHWPDRSAKGAACAALRDSFRRRGVNRYVFAGEAWAETPGVHPADDPDHREL